LHYRRLKNNGLAAWFLFSVAVPVALYAFGVFPAASAFAQAVSQNENPGMSDIFQAGASEHIARTGAAPSGLPIDSIYRSGVALPPVVMAPTRSSFLANWNIVSGVTGYRLDVSTSGSFNSYVSGYQDLDVGNVTSRIVSGLSPGTTYYYRVRAYNALGTTSGSDSNVMTATTATASGLVINPTFDSSILNNPNSAAIQSMINQAIAIYQSLFSDPITVKILFRYSNTQPNGTSMGTSLARSNSVFYPIPWNTFINALRADAKTGNDATANSSLPGSALSTNIAPKSANGRAVGLNTPPAMFANGTVGTGGPYDGIVTLNSNQPFQFSRPPTGSNYDALRSTEHEIDEVLGLGSYLGQPGNDLRPQDLFSWAAPATRNLTSTGSRYFSIDSGNTNIVGFNQDSLGDFGDWLSGNCPQASPYVQNAFSCRGQFSDVTISSPEGITLDVIGYDLGSPNPTPTPSATLGNISTRLQVGTSDRVMIAGFIVQGSAPKRVLIRAAGPSLTQFGVPNALTNPRLELHDTTSLIGMNDNWQTTQIGGVITSDQVAEIQNSGLAPSDPLESAVIATLAPGSYTAIVQGVNGGTGVGIVEVYDLNASSGSLLANISTRGFVQTGDNAMIGGFIVVTQATRVIIRAIGPSLTPFGVPDALANPQLELHDATSLIGRNDDWQTTQLGGIITSDQVAEIQNSQLAPTNPLESAIIATLQPGSYTAIVRGVNNTTGNALVEVYALQ
jgi:Fibronectin type III domain